MNGWMLFGIAILYLGLLFYIAYQGDLGRLRFFQSHRNWAYALSLGVYCTSWTFYGGVGTAVQSGWAFLPIYLGPILMLLFMARPIERIIRITRRENLTSIADFLAARYGRSRSIAVAATLISLLAVVPYLALQLKAIDASFSALSPLALPAGLDQAFIIALVMAGFAVLFGARHVSSAKRQIGLVDAVAFESVVKITALSAVGLLAVWLLFNADAAVAQAALALPVSWSESQGAFGLSFWVSTLLAGVAIICLPRQFHLGVVECPEPAAFTKARWVLPLYLLIITVFIVPIAAAGMQLLADEMSHPDTYVLGLPLSQGHQGLAILAYLGGLSASSAMVIVSTVALSIMISNELVVPYLLRNQLTRTHLPRHMDALILRARRLTILVTVMAGYLFYRLFTNDGQLAAYGLISFAAIAQLAPALFVAVLWKNARADAVLAGMVAGILLWAFCILLPFLLPVEHGLLQEGLWRQDWLRPQALFGTGGSDDLTHGALWSLGVNAGLIALGSLFGRQRFSERVQAEVFLETAGSEIREQADSRALSVHDIELVLDRFLGPAQAEAALQRYEHLYPHLSISRASRAPDSLLRHAERELVGAIGSASTRVVLEGAMSREGLGIDDVARLVSHAAEDLRFSRKLLSTTLENIDQGVSVVDENLQLVAWNQRYLDLFEYPPGLIRIGVPIERIIRYNATRGLCGPGEIEAHVQRRIQHLQNGTAHQFERTRPDGTVIEMRGRPMPGGGFVMSFSDITEHKNIQRELTEINESLEKIVEERTNELALAKDEAITANVSKTQFLAAASHDLLQPLSAARLLTSALQERLSSGNDRETLSHVQGALANAEAMITNLVEINRLDARRIPVNRQALNLQVVLDELASEFQPHFQARGLDFHVLPASLWIESDAHLLRRILQNFLSNALRYTQGGRVVLGVRRRGAQAEIQVLDTGPGIPPEQQERVFEDFARLSVTPSQDAADRGQGLGLGIVRRMADLLGHQVRLRSVPGRGTCMSLTVPRSRPADTPQLQEVRPAGTLPPNLRVLCIDNDPAVLQGLRELLQGWGVQVAQARDRQELLQLVFVPDLLIVDYRLDRETGVDVMLDVFGARLPGLPVILATAERTDEVRELARAHGMLLLHKPLKPAALRAAMIALLKRT